MVPSLKSVPPLFEGRILPFDLVAPQTYAALLVRIRSGGRTGSRRLLTHARTGQSTAIVDNFPTLAQWTVADKGDASDTFS